MQVALKYKQLNEAENKNKTLQFALRTWILTELKRDGMSALRSND